MVTFWLIVLIDFVVFEAAGFICSSTAYSTKIRDILSMQTDYDVYEGDFIFLDKYSYPVGANPSGIYGVTSFDNVNITDPYGLYSNWSYFQRSSNSIIFPLCTPPKSSYFSFVSYIINRFNVVVDGEFVERETLFAELGYSLNNLLWNTSSTDNNVWNSLSTFIQTGDQETFQYFNNLLVSNGINANDINLQTVPEIFAKFVPYEYNANNINQYNQTYDTGNLLMRIAIPHNKTANNIYTNTTRKVYMLQPKYLKGNKPRKRYEPFILNEYSPQNMNETIVYGPALNQYKIDLINYMKQTFGLKLMNETKIGPFPRSQPTSCNVSGCFVDNKNCGGPNCDDLYNEINLYKQISLNNMSYLMIIGIIHSNPDIEQTTYSAIAYYDHLFRPFIPDPVINCFEYNGSGLILPVKTEVDKEYLKNVFVIQITEKQNCIDSLPGFCLDGVLDEDVFVADLAIRNYLNPITKTAPLSTQIVPSILLRFNLQ